MESSSEYKYSVVEYVVQRMESTNKLVFVLTIIGGVLIAVGGIAVSNFLLIPVAVAYVIAGMLVYRVIDTFGVHVSESHKK